MGVNYASDERERDSFGSRIAFYMAAVGSAVGFGNVWRFPGLCADYGGAAFLIPYVLALFTIGIPLLFLEIGLGQYHQAGDVGSFGAINKHLRGIGVCSVVAGFTLLTYYSALLSWSWNAFFNSFSKDSPFNRDDLDGGAAVTYFFTNIAGINADASPPRLNWLNVLYSALTWLFVFVSLAFGTKLTGKITYFTMGFPFFMLFVFLFRGISLEGSGEGISHYVGNKSDFGVLNDKPDIWSAAVSQIFFSLSVTMGVMTAYGSLVPRTEPAFLNSAVIAITNCSFSFFAGFAVFGAIGHLAHLKGVAVTEINFKSFGLVFGTWPVVLGTLPGGIHWIRLLFLTLILLGIDSAFSMLEAVTTVLGDTTYLKDTPKWIVTLVFSILGFVCSLIYVTEAGLIFLDVVDYYINFMLLFLGFMETFAAGWVYGIEEQASKVGISAVLSFMFANFGGAIVGGILWFGAKITWAGFVAYILIYLIFTGIAVALMKNEDGIRSGLFTLYWENVKALREKLQPVIGRVPIVWCFLIKHFIPQILLILFINATTAIEPTNGKPKFGNFADYATFPYQFIGILAFAGTCVAFLIGVVAPDVYKGFAAEEVVGKEEKAEVPEKAVVEEVSA